MSVQLPTHTPDRRWIFTATYSPNLNRPGLAGRAAIKRMADDMRIYVTNTGGVLENDLLVLGWTRAQLTAHGEAARELAQRLSA